MESLSRLDGNLQSLRPGEDWGGSERMDGGEGLGLGDGTGVFQDLADLDELAEQLSQSYGGARMDDVDLDTLARQLGDEAAVDAKTLQELERALRDSGTLRRGSDGTLQLTPKAMRQLGKALLRDVADKMSGRQGQRELRRAGAAGDLSGATRVGVRRHRALVGAAHRAQRRRAPCEATRAAGDGSPIEDIEVQETEARTQACVALLVDTSFSMAMDGRWVPMKRTALALHTLIRSRFRGDALQLIGFGRHAEVMDIEQLTALDAKWDKGTNLHHGLLLANRHFRKHPNAQPVLLIVTDGEPTSHLEANGEVYFTYPPHPLTVAYAVRELDNSRRLGAQTTFFRLGEDPGLARFIDQMAHRVEGRVVAPELDDLGAAVVGSYLGSRSRPAAAPVPYRGGLRRLVRRRPGLLGRLLSGTPARARGARRPSARAARRAGRRSWRSAPGTGQSPRPRTGGAARTRVGSSAPARRRSRRWPSAPVRKRPGVDRLPAQGGHLHGVTEVGRVARERGAGHVLGQRPGAPAGRPRREQVGQVPGGVALPEPMVRALLSPPEALEVHEVHAVRTDDVVVGAGVGGAEDLLGAQAGPGAASPPVPAARPDGCLVAARRVSRDAAPASGGRPSAPERQSARCRGLAARSGRPAAGRPGCRPREVRPDDGGAGPRPRRAAPGCRPRRPGPPGPRAHGARRGGRPRGSA